MKFNNFMRIYNMIPIKFENEFIIEIYQTNSDKIFALRFENLYVLIMYEPHLNSLGVYQIIDEDNFENKYIRLKLDKPITLAQLKDVFKIGQTIDKMKVVGLS